MSDFGARVERFRMGLENAWLDVRVVVLGRYMRHVFGGHVRCLDLGDMYI